MSVLSPLSYILSHEWMQETSPWPFCLSLLNQKGQQHTLCPVSVLRQYLNAMSQAHRDQLFMWPTLLTPCSMQPIAQTVCHVTDSAGPRKHLESRDLRQVTVFLSTSSIIILQITWGIWINEVPPFPFALISSLIMYTMCPVLHWSHFLGSSLLYLIANLPLLSCYPTLWKRLVIFCLWKRLVIFCFTGRISHVLVTHRM